MDAMVSLSPTVDPVDRFNPMRPMNTMGATNNNNNNNRFNMSGGGGMMGGGMRPNFNPGAFGGNNMMMDDSTTAPILLGVSGGLLFISITLLIARLWSRLRLSKRLHSDDWFILGGTVSIALLSSIDEIDRCICTKL